MTRSERIQPVKKHARNQEDQAVRQMAERQKELEAQEQQLSMLRQYKQEYLENWQVTCGQGVSITQMQNYRSFIARIGEAVSQQEGAVETARRAYEEARRGWQGRRRHTKAVGKLQNRLHGQERHAAEKKEQRELDDWVQANNAHGMG